MLGSELRLKEKKRERERKLGEVRCHFPEQKWMGDQTNHLERQPQSSDVSFGHRRRKQAQ